jgi:hypothetical protein
MAKVDGGNLKAAELNSDQLAELQAAEKKLNKDRAGQDIYLLAFTRR